MVNEGYKEVRIGPKTKLIPEEWKVKKLKKVIKKRKGKRPNKLFESKNGENFIPYLSVNYLRGNDVPEWCSKDDDNKVEVKENEILMIWDGSYSGNVFMGFNGALSSTMARLKCEDNINNKYLYYQLRNNFKIFQSTTIGTSVPHVAGKIFENLNIPTPRKKEQEKIASILSSVDKSIEKTDEVIEETKELKKGLMQELLIKGIGHSEFKGTILGKIPAKWDIKQLRDICNKVTDGTHDTPKEVNDGYPFITAKNITNGKLDFEDCGYVSEKDHKKIISRSKPEKGDILFTHIGTIGQVVEVNVDFEFSIKNVALFKPDNELIISKYFKYSLQSNIVQGFIKRILQGGVQQYLGLTTLRGFNIPVPPLQEQKKIASILSSVDAKIKKEKEYKAKLERLKKGLMQKLLTGEIRVNTEMEV